MTGMAFVILALIGLAIYSFSQIKQTPWTSSLSDPVITSTLRQELPHFEYFNEGKTLKAQNFEGKWTLLSFWAHWCGPCLEEMPALDQLSQGWQGPEFEVITVNVDDPNSEDFEAARKFLVDNEIAIPTLFDKSGDLKKAFDVHDLPTHFLISPEKQIVWKARGAFKWNGNKAHDQLMKIMEDEQQKKESTGAPGPDSEPDSGE